MTLKLMSKTERIAAMNAFANWMASQEIDPGIGAHLMMTLSGTIIAAIANDAEHLAEGIKLLQEELKRTAMIAFKERMKKK